VNGDTGDDDITGTSGGGNPAGFGGFGGFAGIGGRGFGPAGAALVIGGGSVGSGQVTVTFTAA
jgi:hypothetical protein